MVFTIDSDGRVMVFTIDSDDGVMTDIDCIDIWLRVDNVMLLLVTFMIARLTVMADIGL